MRTTNLEKEIWEGWTIKDFITELEPLLDTIMSGSSWENPIKTKREMADFCKNNQPYYKRNIPEVNNYFINKYKITK